MMQNFDREGAAARKAIPDDEAGWEHAGGHMDARPGHAGQAVDEETLHAYVDGRLDEPERLRVERAMREDPELAQRLQTYARFDRNLRAAFGKTPDSPFDGDTRTAGTDDADPDDPDDGGPPPQGR